MDILVSKPSFIEKATFFKSEKAKIYGWAFKSMRGKPALLVYQGKSRKAWVHCQYKDEARRAEVLTDLINSRVEKFKRDAEWKAKQYRPSELKVGDILNTLWGYEQTNVEFYIVKKTMGKRKVQLCRIAIDEYIPDSSMSGKVYPDALREIGEPFERMVINGNSVKIHQSANATPWDGKYIHTSSYH